MQSIAIARQRYRSGNLTVRHAHGYIVQTLAEMRSATSYKDANGNLLRVHPYAFTGTEPVNPARIACSGGQ